MRLFVNVQYKHAFLDILYLKSRAFFNLTIHLDYIIYSCQECLSVRCQKLFLNILFHFLIMTAFTINDSQLKFGYLRRRYKLYMLIIINQQLY